MSVSTAPSTALPAIIDPAAPPKRNGHVPPPRRRFAWFPWLAVAGAFAYCMFWGSHSFGVQDNNEGLYAEVAREMVARGDWVVPHLNGVPYLEKPPALYWLVGGLFQLFGEHDWVVRLAPVLCFGGTLAGVVWIARLLGSTTAGRNAALVLCSAAGVVVMSRSLLFDVPLTCAVTWALALVLQWRLTGARGALRAAYAVVAVGLLIKGLVTLVLVGGAVAISAFITERSWRGILRHWDAAGAALFVLIAAPWHLLAARREPGFPEFYFINEHVRRFLGSRQPHDFYTGPYYYYLERLPLYLGVWSFALLFLVRPHARRVGGDSPILAEGRRLLGSAALLAIGFFSLSEGKANYYLLSVMPTLALLVALGWPADGVRSRRVLTGAATLAAVGAVFAAAPIVLAGKPQLAPVLHERAALLGALAAALLGIAAAMAYCAQRGFNRAAFGLVAAGGLMMLLPLPALLKAADPLLSQRELVRYLSQSPRRPVVLYRDYEKLSSVAFYRRQAVPVLDCDSNELFYAYHHFRDASAFLDESALRSLARDGQVWVIATPRRLDEAMGRLRPFAPHVAVVFPNAVVLTIGAAHPDPAAATAVSHATPPGRNRDATKA